MNRSRQACSAIRVFLPALLLVAAAACGGERSTVVLVPGEDGMAGAPAESEPDTDDGWSDEKPTEDEGPPPEPFSMSFRGMFDQEVQWAALGVSVVGARIERGMDTEEGDAPWVATYPWPSPEDIYAELDIRIHSEDHEIVDYSARDTWDLILADGTRVQSGNTLNVMISPGDTATTTLRYPLDAVVDFAGASLELNGVDRGELEPERIPLDAEHVRQFPLRLTDAAGTTLEPVPFETEGEITTVRIEVEDAFYDMNDPVRGLRTRAGERIVRLDLIATAAGSSGVSIDDSDFHIVVDGHTFPVADGVGHESLREGESAKAHVAFRIEASARRFDLVFDMGWDAPEERIAVDLDNAVRVAE